MDPRQIREGDHAIVYDAARLAPPGPALFEPEAARRRGWLTGRPDGGRGSACFLEVEGIPAVLRPYRRGGLLAGLLEDRYLRRRLAATRPWREWWLLARLHAEGLPVPAPLAARVIPRRLFYCGEIVVERLAARTLAETLQRRPLEAAEWRRVGEAIGRLHRRGVDHADLNAHNILLGEADPAAVHVIDLDRARLRRPAQGWQRRNLRRLERSLDKLAATFAAPEARGEATRSALLHGWRRPPGGSPLDA